MPRLLPPRDGEGEGVGYRGRDAQSLKIPSFATISRRFARLGTLVGYGSGMAGKGDQAADWLDQVFEQLRVMTDQAIAVVAAAAPPSDVAEAEKRARAIGVLARTAKAVAALAIRPARKTARAPEEDGMSEDDRELSDDEERAVRAELESRIDHLVGIAERKGFSPAAPGGDAARGIATAAEGDAAADTGPGLAG